MAQVADRVAAFIRLQETARAARKLAILIPDYPSAPGRTGYAVGLDVPSSVLAMLHDLREQGYAVEAIPQSPRALLDALERSDDGLGLGEYLDLSVELPTAAIATVEAAWGKAEDINSREAPPSVLPDISPSRGEISSFIGAEILSTSIVGEGRCDIRSPPLRGRCPAGQRGV